MGTLAILALIGTVLSGLGLGHSIGSGAAAAKRQKKQMAEQKEAYEKQLYEDNKFQNEMYSNEYAKGFENAEQSALNALNYSKFSLAGQPLAPQTLEQQQGQTQQGVQQQGQLVSSALRCGGTRKRKLCGGRNKANFGTFFSNADNIAGLTGILNGVGGLASSIMQSRADRLQFENRIKPTIKKQQKPAFDFSAYSRL